MASKKFGPVIPYQERLARRNQSFTTQVDVMIVNTEAKMLAVIQTAITDTVNEMQTPTEKGGKMRVDTGFLRSSGMASLSGLPSGPLEPEKEVSYSWSAGPLATILADMKIGDTFYFGWTANYAKYREAYDGFMEGALMKWQQRIDAAVSKLKGRSA